MAAYTYAITCTTGTTAGGGTATSSSITPLPAATQTEPNGKNVPIFYANDTISCSFTFATGSVLGSLPPGTKATSFKLIYTGHRGWIRPPFMCMRGVPSNPPTRNDPFDDSTSGGQFTINEAGTGTNSLIFQDCNGVWGMSGTIVDNAASPNTYSLPDPEMQVGTGNPP